MVSTKVSIDSAERPIGIGATWETLQEKKMAVYVDANDSSAFHTSVDHDLSVLCVNTVAPNGRSDLWTDEKANLIWRDLGENVD